MGKQGNYKEFSKEEKDLLKETIDKNMNPNESAKLFYKNFNIKYSYNTIKSKAKLYYKMEWSSKEKKYIKIEDEIEGQLEFEELLKSEIKFKESSNDNINSSLNDLILNYLETINKNLCSLNTRLNKIENYIQKNSPQKRKELTQDFIDIFSANNKRESVNINAEIKKRIIEKMAKDKDILRNQSAAINTALLIALFNDDSQN